MRRLMARAFEIISTLQISQRLISRFISFLFTDNSYLQALEYLAKGNPSNKFNLGSGVGYSVKEIIEASRKVTGHPIPVEMKQRREGDPAALIASSDKAEEVLGWTRKYTSIEDIVRTAWNFHQKHPKGY